MRDRPNYSLAKSKARQLLGSYGFEEPPVNPITIARGEGIHVKFVTFDEGHTSVSGFYDPEEHAIYVNKDEFPLRQTFTIAHELGHALLHREWAKSNQYEVLLRDDFFRSDEPHEREANAFAANLLVPRSMLDRYSGNLSSRDLSKLFAVSVPFIENRLKFEYGY